MPQMFCETGSNFVMGNDILVDFEFVLSYLHSVGISLPVRHLIRPSSVVTYAERQWAVTPTST